jgi:hypothetical protein
VREGESCWKSECDATPNAAGSEGGKVVFYRMGMLLVAPKGQAGNRLLHRPYMRLACTGGQPA